jgi:hypothetical protein
VAASQTTLDRWRAMSPHVQRLDGTRRGYLALTVFEARLQADLVVVKDPAAVESDCEVMASHVVEAGDPRIQPA